MESKGEKNSSGLEGLKRMVSRTAFWSKLIEFGREVDFSGSIKRTEVRLISATPEEVRIYCPRSGRYLTLGARFPDIESHDNFFLSERSIQDAVDWGPDFAFIPPNHFVLERQNDGNNGDYTIENGNIPKLFGIPEAEFDEGCLIAMDAFVKYYIKKNPPNLSPASLIKI